MRIYVASSWRNLFQPEAVSFLRARGNEVYDFRNPAPGNHGFAWAAIDPQWQDWTTQEYLAALHHPTAWTGYQLDKGGLDWAEAGLLVLPCGRSAHLEAGYLVGQGKPVWIWSPERMEPELMALLCAGIVERLENLPRQVVNPGERVNQ